ncbi:MAG: S16 family serine protease [Acholeplasmataceae bacterium]
MNNFKNIFHTIIFAYIYLMMALVIPSNFTVVAPNKTQGVYELFEVENSPKNHIFRSVSVLSMDYITPFARMVYELYDKFEVTKTSKYITELSFRENFIRGDIQKNSSYEQAIVSAYLAANDYNSNITIDYNYLGMIIEYRESIYTKLKIGDLIIDLDNKNFDNYYEMALYFITHDELTLQVKRNNEIENIKITKSNINYFNFYPKYEIIDTNPKYNLNLRNEYSKGPSAGFMYTLSLYYDLVNLDFINEKIVGTGTIRYNSNIGEIGGLKQKVYTAISENIKYFILPMSQYDEVKHLSNKIILIPVNNLREAIIALHENFN